MAKIINADWDCMIDYDNKLKEIVHYKLHPELLPYIGRHYPNTRIMILGESHYLSNEESDEVKQMENWYEMPTSHYPFKYTGNFITREVVHNYLIGWRTKAHTMFSNPTKALVRGWNISEVNISEAFTAFTFFNYFQRPASCSGETIALKREDEEKSANILDEVIKVLNPKKVVFLSKKAYDSYCSQREGIDTDKMDYVVHPTCSHWNKEDGGEKLCKIFSSIEKYCGFTKEGSLKRQKAEEILEEDVKGGKYTLLKQKQRRFRSDCTTCRIYVNGDDSDSVEEVAWYLMDGVNKFGMGFVVRTGYFWIWNYNNEWYMSDEEMRSKPSLLGLYNDVLKLIEKF